MFLTVKNVYKHLTTNMAYFYISDTLAEFLIFEGN